ncbi:MAG: GatB/YqeY domain-containing protein [Armatimonadetes bacterium]|nr:GatB/YqeY domain-containing protein [Armatimonadota bacterium]
MSSAQGAFLDRISEDLKSAMKARDKPRLDTLRMVKTALKNEEIELGPLDDDRAVKVLVRLCKQRRDSIEQFGAAGREDLASIERRELAIIEEYLPSEPDEAEIRGSIERAVAQTGASSARQMGEVMKRVMAGFAGRPVDGKRVSQLVRERLSG